MGVFLITLNIDDTTTSGTSGVVSAENIYENDEFDEDHAHAADNPLPLCIFLRSIFLPDQDFSSALTPPLRWNGSFGAHSVPSIFFQNLRWQLVRTACGAIATVNFFVLNARQ